MPHSRERRDERARVRGRRASQGPGAPPEESGSDARGTTLLVCAGLVVLVLVVFGQVVHHQFLHFDDDEYIYANPHVMSGLAPRNIAWAFTAYHSNNWHPLTWISHMVDSQLFGMNPGMHHLVNVLLHALNAVLLFLLLRRMTGALWRCAFVAAIFAVHPLRVESVAWASERKDVLSMLFGLLTIWLYASYARRPTLARYLPVVLMFALGLMAKPMLVTLPLVLLLLDYWPLRRLGRTGRDAAPAASPALPWLDKLPLLVLAVASSLLTLAAQSKGGVVVSFGQLSVGMRVANALVSFVRYAFKLLVPIQQAFYYPYPRDIPVLEAAGALVLIAAVTLYFVRVRRDRPYALVGWLWYLGTLVPVIGLVQVATQAIADRYTYLPSVGFFIVVAWWAADLARTPSWRPGVVAVCAVAVAAFAAKARAQTAFWQDGITLFAHDTRVVRDNVLGYRNLAVALSDSGRAAEAIPLLEDVLKRYPRDAVALYDMGSALWKLGRGQAAADCYRESLRYQPDQPRTHYNLGTVLSRLGRTDEAIEQFRAAIRMEPGFAPAHNNLANALSKLGKVDEAIAEYREAARLDPGYAVAFNNLGTALRSTGRTDEALAAYARALEINPRFAAAEFNAGVIYLRRGDSTEARRHFDRAAEMDSAVERKRAGQPR